MSKRRGRKTRGRIFTRGKSGRFYLQYYVNGSQKVVALKNEAGEPVKDEREAEQARDRILNPITSQYEVERLRRLKQELATAEEKLEAAEAEKKRHEELQKALKNRLPIAEAWNRHPYTYSAPKKGETRRELTEKTVKDYKCQWNKFVKWMSEQDPDRLYMEDVTPEDAKAYSSWLRETEGLSNKRHNMLIDTAGVMFKLAELANPFADIDRFAWEPESRKNLERNELLDIINGSKGELRRLFTIAVFTGLRLGDCATLDWNKDIKFTHNRIIRKTKKTGKTVSIPIHPTLLKELASTPEDKRQGPACPELAARYERDPSALSKLTRRAIEDLTDAKTVEEALEGRKRSISRRGFHSFRHSFVTECARNGVPIGQIRDWIGHQSTQITEIYEEWKEDESQQRILDALPVAEASKEEKARADLHKLAEALPVKDIQALLKYAKNRQQKKLTPAKA